MHRIAASDPLSDAVRIRLLYSEELNSKIVKLGIAQTEGMSCLVIEQIAVEQSKRACEEVLFLISVL
jgi:hypothetical protein